jgi:hypothetical protein
MKKTIIILTAIASLVSCKNTNEQQVSTDNSSVQQQEVNDTSIPDKKAVSSNNLCQINGQDWDYTEASGIVSTDTRTGKRTALITFKKKLEKGSEHIQLYYDADSFELYAVSLILRHSKKGGGPVTCYYNLKPETRKRNPQGELSGTIDLSDSSSASGVAEVKNLNIDNGKEELLNPEDAVISVTGLKFTNIGYSDLD